MIISLMNKVNYRLQNKVSTNLQVLVIDFYLIKHLNSFNVLVEKYIWNFKLKKKLILIITVESTINNYKGNK